MTYSQERINLRVAWLRKCIAEKTVVYLNKLKGAKSCKCLMHQLVVMDAYLTLLCGYDPDAETNMLNSDDLDCITEKIEMLCSICFK
jgi:hypothetical protein